MIDYDRSAWWRTVFSFNGTVLPAVLGRVGLLTGLSLALVLLDEYVLSKFGVPMPVLDQLGHTVLGVALGLFIVFRTNSSYARFWEARTHWGGVLNQSRNLVRVATAYAGPADDLARLVSAYALALRHILRDHRDFSDVRGLVPISLFEKLPKAADPPGVLAKGMSEWIAAKLTAGRIAPQQAQHLESIVCSLVDSQGGCEKIHRTPMPFVYASLIKQILLVYLVSLPFVVVAKMGFAAPIVVAVVALGLLGIEEAGVSVENPFSHDPNALPLEAICEKIASNVVETSR